LMRHMSILRAAATLVSVCVISLGFAQVAHAGVVGTQVVAAAANRAAQVETLQNVIMSDQVSSQLVALGVDPAWAAERVSSMTDEELARLSSNMEQMPAGAGVVYLVGAVFIVLIILELTGVIDIFKKV
jgi:hypothetical protein